MSEKNNKSTLRQRFASDNPVLIARAEYVTVAAEPYAKAYFNGNDNKYEGAVLSSVKESENVQSPSRSVLYAVEKGFSPIAKGTNESVRADQIKINRMNITAMSTDKGNSL